MSSLIETAVAALQTRLGRGFDGSARFVIPGEGVIVLDGEGARAADEPAEVTLTADADTFQAILSGDLGPMEAFMGGRLSVDGNMGMAMRLAGVLG